MRDMSKDFLNTPDQLSKTRAYYDALIWRHRTKTLIEKLLGWECFSSWDDYQRKYGAKEWGVGAGQPFTTSTPVAFCEHQYGHPNPDAWEYRVFSPDHEDLKPFNPTTSMDDAWTLVQALAKKEDVERDGFHTEGIFFARIRASVRTTIGDNTKTPLSLKELAQVTPLNVCDAVYAAVQHMEPPKPVTPLDIEDENQS